MIKKVNNSKGKGQDKGKGKGLDKKDQEEYYELNSCFRGKIDEMVILRRAMPDKEVAQVYEIGRPVQD